MIAEEGLSTLETLIGWAQIIGSLATAGAFIVTYRTLKEMKRQTDLSNNPVLKIHFRIMNPEIFKKTLESKTYIKSEFDTSPYKSWQTIIHNNLQQDLSGLQDQFLVVEFCNCGKSEISKVNLNFNLTVKMIDNDVIPISFNPTEYSKFFSFPVELMENDSVFLGISNIKYFPNYCCRLSNIEYLDIHNKKYSDFIGETQKEETNEMLRPKVEEIPF